MIESKYPVLVISFNNCELHSCHLDGYKNNLAALFNRLAQIDSFFESKSKFHKYRIWFNVDDSVLSDDTAERVVQSVLQIKDNIIKIAFIGVDKKKLFNKLLKSAGFDKPLQYFTDAEVAKEWLE